MGIEKELDNIRKVLEDKANNDTKDLIKAYKKALDETRKELGLLYSSYAVDGVLDTTKATQAQMLNKIEKFLIGQAQDLGALDESITTTILKSTGEEAGLRTIYALDKGMSALISTNLVNPTAVDLVLNATIDGNKFSDRIWLNKAKLTNRIKRDLTKAIVNGQSIDKLARNIKKDFETSAYESKRLIQTEVAHMQTAISEDIYKNTDVIKEVIWLATLDEKTREYHGKYKTTDLDGHKWEKNSIHPSPQNYVACRCTLAPVIEGYSPTKRKDNESKEIIDYTTYEKWLESRNIEQ